MNATIELPGPTVPFYKSFAKVAGDAPSGLLLSFLWERQRHTPNDWITFTQAEFDAACGLSRHEQETCRRILRDRGLLEEMRAGIPALLYFRIQVKALSALLRSHYYQEGK